MSARKIDKQRCFKIAKDRLDLFLVKLAMEHTNLLHMEADYVFDNDAYYDVVVNYYGSYPFIENQVEKFAEQLRNPERSEP